MHKILHSNKKAWGKTEDIKRHENYLLFMQF